MPEMILAIKNGQKPLKNAIMRISMIYMKRPIISDFFLPIKSAMTPVGISSRKFEMANALRIIVNCSIGTCDAM